MEEMSKIKNIFRKKKIMLESYKKCLIIEINDKVQSPLNTNK